jgi:hypothetical protein
MNRFVSIMLIGTFVVLIIYQLWLYFSSYYTTKNDIITNALIETNKYDVNRSKLKFFIYNLSTSFSYDLVNLVSKRFQKSNCDWSLTPCTEKYWSHPYSDYRQCSSEIIFYELMKRLSPKYITKIPSEASFFVIPYFIKTGLYYRWNFELFNIIFNQFNIVLNYMYLLHFYSNF